MIKDILETQINQVMADLFSDWSGSVELDEVKNEQFGDYALSTAMVLARQLGQPPRQIATRLAEAIENDEALSQNVERVSVDGPGFINLRLRPECLWQEALQSANVDGQPILPADQRQKVMVEFSSPNIAKPFNVGHLRSTIIGDSLARMLDYLGHEVLRDNHLGDWGTQYGKLAVAVTKWGDWQAIAADPIPELFQLYVRFHKEEEDSPELTEEGRAYFKKLEDGDPEVVAVWKRLVDLSLADFGQLYMKLGVTFDMQLGESFYEPYLAEVIDECKRTGVARQSEGAWLIFFDDDAELSQSPLMIQKSNGTSTYGTRDLAGIKYRFNQLGLDRLLIEIGNEQRLYFRQIIEASKRLGWIKDDQLQHIGHGLFMLPTGKMSTRRGETVWVKDLIDELEERATQIIRQKTEGLSDEEVAEVAEIVAVGALKYNDLSQNRSGNVVFDKEKSLSLEGNSAPYLQYSVTRGRKLLNGADQQVADIVGLSGQVLGGTVPLSEYERTLLLQLGRFNATVREASQVYLPNVLATYLFQLSQKYNAFYQNEPILQAEDGIRQQRLLLVALTVEVLTKGLDLLGIDVPSRM